MIFILLLALPGAWGLVQPQAHFEEVNFYFNVPREEVDFFASNESVGFNGDSQGRNIEDLKATLRGDIPSIGAKAFFQEKKRYVPANGTIDIILTIRVPSSAPDGIYRGSLSIKGKNVEDYSKEIKLEVEHPPPTLVARWNKQLGKVKAGEAYSSQLLVEEYYGYRNAGNITLNLFKTGPAKLDFEEKFFSLGAGKSKKFTVDLRAENTSLIPGNYTITPQLTSDRAIARRSIQNLNYSVPFPEMAISPASLNFGKVTFRAGKDTSSVEMVVREEGGYTPLEDLELSLLGGEEGWINFSAPGHVPPGGERKVDLNLRLPPYASLGVKTWNFSLDARFIPPEQLGARAQVYFPGIEEAEEELAGVEPLKSEPQVLNTTARLVGSAENETQVGVIAGVMAVYNGVLGYHRALSPPGGVEEKARQLLSAGSSLMKVEAGNQTLQGGRAAMAGNISRALKGHWIEKAEGVFANLERMAGREEETNLKKAAFHFKLLKELAEFHPQKEASLYQSQQRKAEASYRGNLTRAIELRVSSQSELEGLKASNLWLGDNLVILNPFAYRGTLEKLEGARRDSEKAEDLFSLAGEGNEVERQKDFTARLEGIKERAEGIFRVYISILTLVGLAYIARLTLGIQRFLKDSEELKTGEVLMREEEG